MVGITNGEQPDGRGTAGVLNVVPSSRNVMTGRVDFTIDLRQQRFHGGADGEGARACSQRSRRPFGVHVQLRLARYNSLTPFDPDSATLVRERARDPGLTHLDMNTGADHAAVHMAWVCPPFVPCRDGIGHNEIEHAQSGHLEANCNVLFDAMLERAGMRSRRVSSS